MRMRKGTFITRRFVDEDFSKTLERARMIKIARNLDPNDEDEPIIVMEAINYLTHKKQ